MSLFSWIFGSRVSPALLKDRIWLTRHAKSEGLRQAAQSALGQGKLVLVVAQFSATLTALGNDFRAAGIPFGMLDPRAMPREGLYLGPAEHLTELPNTLGDRVLLLVAERHFLRSQDQQLVELTEQCSGARIGFFLSMEDPLLAVFAGDWIVPTLRRLGMQETETIESRIVNKQIARAQKKLSRLAITARPAESPQEWLHLNCPEMEKKEERRQ